MSSRNKANVKKLFEFWCELTPSHGVDRSTRAGTAAPAGVILESFPESFRDEKTIADIPAFAFPCEFTCDSVQTYSFVLTTDDSKWRFGFCRHDPKTDTAMVIITYLPWHDTFLRLLTVLAELRRTNNGEFRKFLTEAYQRGVPDPGGNLKLFYSGGQSYFVFERPLQFQLPSIPENHNLNLYYNFVEPKNMIAVFAAMLAERRIIFTSNRLDKLSSCIQAANAFLYPMVWQHIFIPVLPMKLKDYLSAPMPYLIGVPELVLETMTPDELGDVVILNCDRQTLDSPFDDTHEMPAEIVSQLKKQLSHSNEHIGDRVSKIFLCVLVQLIGGYRDAVEFRDTGKSFNRDKFIETRPSHLRPFLRKMMELQIFQQFIDERIEMLNTGLGFSDEFELETVRYAENMKKRGRNYQFLKNVKDKTNPAVKSAVKSVKEGSRGVKTAYKDLKSKFRDNTPPNINNNNNHSDISFRSHLSSNSQVDGFIVGSGKTFAGHHSAPSSPIFNKRGEIQHLHHHHHHRQQQNYQQPNNDPRAGGFKYASPAEINGASNTIRRAPIPLAMSSSTTHIQPNGYSNLTPASIHHNTHLGTSPAISPASSLCSSEMNLSQELQNHPLFKSPIVDRSLKPSSSLELNHRITSTRTGGQAPARPPPPMIHSLQSTPLRTHNQQPGPSYYNHPYITAQKQQQHKPQQQQEHTKHTLSLSPAHVEKTKQSSGEPVHKISSATFTNSTAESSSNNIHNIPDRSVTLPSCHTSTPNNKIIATETTFDHPPDMMSPPVPPRRFGGSGCAGGTNSGAVIASGIKKLQRNCWQDAKYGQSQSQPKQCNAIELRNSSSSNSSTASALSFSTTASSSDHSFESAASTFSHKTLYNEMALAAANVPVPAPRLKKESLRSLQPHHLQMPQHRPQGSLHSASSSYASQEDTMNDLISLDDSNNTSFDLEDFDPLNQNARPLPIRNSGSGRKKSTTLPTGSSPALIAPATTAVAVTLATTTTTTIASSISNPIYPYFTPQHTRPLLMPPTTKPPLPPTDITSYDDDFELLRKYGLDQFTLTTTAGVTSTSTTATSLAASSSAFLKSNGHQRIAPSSSHATSMSNKNNWTTFD